jgi:hypothetical protein
MLQGTLQAPNKAADAAADERLGNSVHMLLPMHCGLINAALMYASSGGHCAMLL